jgi:protocatechuate 4,5-dioxygenase alpha chain
MKRTWSGQDDMASDAKPMKDPDFDLEWPGTLVYSPQLALQGHALNKFALSLRSPANRQRFLADEAAYMREFDLSDEARRSVTARDWTALLQAGGHLQAILKVAATVGQGLWHIGAHHAQVDVATLQAACPRKVAALPKGGD